MGLGCQVSGAVVIQLTPAQDNDYMFVIENKMQCSSLVIYIGLISETSCIVQSGKIIILCLLLQGTSPEHVEDLSYKNKRNLKKKLSVPDKWPCCQATEFYRDFEQCPFSIKAP